jgi:ribonuclease HII
MLLCGIDEAGRGPIIGPMVICGVALDEHKVNYLRDLQVKDSKLLTPAKRERIFRELTTVGSHYIIIVEPEEIDAAVMGTDGMNLNWLEAKKSVDILAKLQPQRAFVDCPSPNLPAYTNYMLKLLPFPLDLRCEHKADAKYEIVSAASIIAKVTRDRLIEEIKKKHGVDFGSGYIADPKTAAFVKENPDFPHIRKSWAPYKKLIIERKQRGIGDF